MRIARLLFVLTISIGTTSLAHGQGPRPIEFNRDVRPILSDTCFHCHGPDKAKRKAGLSFDTQEAATIDLGGHRAIVAGNPDESELIKRITSKDKSKQMPPPSAPVTLTQKQIDTLTQWIKEGAAWQKHWAFLAPVRAPLPPVKNKTWAINAIDHFILARLEAEGLTPSPAAEAVTLIRRMSLDLTGLPPTPAEVEKFVKAWDAPNANRELIVGQLADRLLASPRYGERMAQRWLDNARYADTNGYQTDGERTMWRWRDWVIDAFNDNMPFDRFTIEQIAGDLLPKPTLEQRIATGFNRNHRGNSEGGIIPEEYAAEYVVDRVDTTSTVWLGLTAGCARCHDHKYDPITQKEFYQLFAYFNNVPEKGKAIKYGNSRPYIKSPTREQERQLSEMRDNLLRLRTRFQRFDLDQAQLEWQQKLDRPIEWSFQRHLVKHFPLDDLTAIVPLGGEPTVIPGIVGNALRLHGRTSLDAGDVGKFGFFDQFSMGAWIKPDNGNAGAILSRMVDTDRADGYLFAVKNGKLHVELVKRWLDDAIRIETIETVPSNEWRHVFFTYDGSREAKGIKIYIDGKPAQIKVHLDDLNQNFNTSEPFRIGAGGGSRFQGAIDDVRIFDDVLAPLDAAAVANLLTIPSIISIERRTPVQNHILRTYFLEKAAPEAIRVSYQRILTAEKALEKFDATIPTTMVMEEMPTPRATHILLRGEYDKKGIRVYPGVPAALPALPTDAPPNRLGFARWLVAAENPLTARVAVNRHWQMLFGSGIVRTVEDFGAQGDWPSHPELLDWLAVEFREQGWDVKKLLKTIVTSATYRQSSRVTPALLQKDPDNRLLARGPRFRLSADVIRDQALFASGLLIEKQGGPSVKPYQPTGLAKELTGTEDYVQDRGASLYRRSMYTFWKRTIAPPTMMNFDAANRETCVVRETRTNTPLQALNLMNDVTFVEAARVMAERVMKAEKTPASRLAFAFRLAASRPPLPSELNILQSALERHHAHYRANDSAALQLVSAGEAARDRTLDVAEHAAYAALCSLILNLDEVITKE